MSNIKLDVAGQNHGSWVSPISAALVAAGGVGLGGLATRSGSSGTEFWWLESRPAEAGRVALVRRRSGEAPEDVLNDGWSVRTRVHEYGGGAFWMGRDLAFFVNYEDQILYSVNADTEVYELNEPAQLTPYPTAQDSLRYCDGAEHPTQPWLACVREAHADSQEPVNEIVAIQTTPSDHQNIAEPVVLVSGPDFVAEPRFSPDGKWISWLQWNHPNMPWDSTQLCVAQVSETYAVGPTQVITGMVDLGLEDDSSKATSIQGSGWTADGRLVFSSDRLDSKRGAGFWNLYCWNPVDSEISQLTHFEGEEVGAPAWVFGIRNWVELNNGDLLLKVTTDAASSLRVLAADGQLKTLQIPEAAIIEGDRVGNSVGDLSSMVATDEGFGLIIGSTLALPTICSFETTGQSISLADFEVIRPADSLDGLTGASLSAANSITFESDDDQVHAFFYPPKHCFPDPTENDSATGNDQLPPLIVMGHGGPTSHSTGSLNLKIQYWTSRGFAVVDVNYRGSSGFGRSYREKLRGAWGVADVADCINAAKHLAQEELVDENRLAIRGGSAGGFTVLSALTQSNIFAAGTNLYGVADLGALAADTHKFESRYLDRLVGPWPEAKDIYDMRSPINNTEKLDAPLLVLQGSEDKVVPPNQSEAIVAALESKGVAHAYVCFEGEQHGFRKGDTIVRSLELELWFYGKVFGFEPAIKIDPAERAVGLG